MKMIKAAVLFVFTVFLTCEGMAQNFEGDARRITDTIFSRMDSISRANLAEDVWTRTCDSITYALVVAHLNGVISQDEYSWPYWYLGRIRMYWPNKDTGIKAPTETGRYLLKSKYHVRMNGVSNGCISQNAFVLHDSLMTVAIRKRYGDDFFERANKEAEELDKHHAGLTLPYIGHPDSTVSILLRTFDFVKALPSEVAVTESGCYLRIEFLKGKVNAVYVCRRFFYVQQDLGLMLESPRLTRLANRLKWTSPKFQNQIVDQVVLLDMNNKALGFN